MEIKILGTGCPNCKTTQAVVEKVVQDLGLDAQITKVENIIEIMKFNTLSTPAIVVNNIVKFKGRVPSESEVKRFLDL